MYSKYGLIFDGVSVFIQILINTTTDPHMPLGRWEVPDIWKPSYIGYGDEALVHLLFGTRCLVKRGRRRGVSLLPLARCSPSVWLRRALSCFPPPLLATQVALLEVALLVVYLLSYLLIKQTSKKRTGVSLIIHKRF